MLSELKNFKVQTILVLDYKKRNDRNIFYSSAKLITNNSENDGAFKSMHQRVMTKIKDYAGKDSIVMDMIVKHSIKTFKCNYKEKKWE